MTDKEYDKIASLVFVIGLIMTAILFFYEYVIAYIVLIISLILAIPIGDPVGDDTCSLEP